MRLTSRTGWIGVTLLALGVSGLHAQALHSGATQVQLAAWLTSASAQTKEDEALTTIPETSVVVRASRPGDLLIHFCSQVDNAYGGRTLVRATVDGVVAEPDLEPATIFSWEQYFPQTRCMDWVAPAVPRGEHLVEIQWSNDLGGESRVAYRTLIVFAPAEVLRLVAAQPAASD